MVLYPGLSDSKVGKCPSLVSSRNMFFLPFWNLLVVTWFQVNLSSDRRFININLYTVNGGKAPNTKFNDQTNPDNSIL